MNVNTTRATIRNLQPFFTYNSSVAAFTVGGGPISSSILVTLPQAGQCYAVFARSDATRKLIVASSDAYYQSLRT